MRKFFVIALGTVTILALLGAVGLGYLLAKFDPNDYKSQFQAALEEATGWKITLHDKLSLSYLPGITLTTGRVSVELPGSQNGQSAHIEELTLYLSGEHLHQGFLDVEEVLVRELTLSQDSIPLSLLPDDGSNSIIGDALRSLEADEGMTRDIVALPAPEVSAPAAPAPQTGIRLQVRFPGKKLILVDSVLTGKDPRGNDTWTLFFSRAEFANLGLGTNMLVKAGGEFTDTLHLKKADFSLEGVCRLNENETLGGRLSAVRLRVEGLGDLPLAVEGALALEYTPHTGALSLKDIQARLHLADGLGAHASENADNNSVVSGNLALVPPKEGMAGTITGNLRADYLNLDMLLHGLDPAVRFVESSEETLKGAPNFTRPKVSRVLTASTSTQLERVVGKNEYPSNAPGGKKNDSAFPFAGLTARYSLKLNLEAQELVVRGLPLERVALQAQSTGRKTTVPFSFTLFGAQTTGRAVFNETGKLPEFSLSANCQKMHMGKLSSFWTSNYYVGGVGNGFVEAAGRGSSASDIIGSLKGKAAFEIKNGEVRGFALIPPDLPHFQNLPDNFLFRRLGASANIEAGKANFQDISLDSGILQGKGSGVIHLDFGQLDIAMNFSQEERPDTVPVFISGPFAALSSTVDAAKYSKAGDRQDPGRYYDSYNSPYQQPSQGGYDNSPYYQPDNYDPPQQSDPYQQNPYGQLRLNSYIQPQENDPYRQDNYNQPQQSDPYRQDNYNQPQQNNPYRQDNYNQPQQYDPYQQYLNKTPLNGVQWQSQ